VAVDFYDGAIIYEFENIGPVHTRSIATASLARRAS
jgi:hypothetical protein